MDEKGYLSKPSNHTTFTLELFYKGQSALNTGWFYDDTKSTTHYLLCWPEREPINIYKEKLELEHIYCVEIMLINRVQLQSYLQSTLEIDANSINENYSSLVSRKVTTTRDPGINYVYSDGLQEKPLNLMLQKQKYLESGSVVAHYIVSEKCIKKL